MEEIREIIEGSFTEGSYVVVNIDGNVVKRKVYNCSDDLYVIYKGAKYLYCEFSYKGE